MMRLQRVGRKNDPTFRIVVVDKRTGPKSNKNVAILGSYNPKLNHVQVDKTAATEWLSKGVQPSDTVHNILVAQKVIEGKKVNVLPKKSPIVSETPAEEAATPEAPAAEEDGAEESADTPAAETAETTEEAPAEDAEAPKEETPVVVSEKTSDEEVSSEETKEADAPAEEAEAPKEEAVSEETPAAEEDEKKE